MTGRELEVLHALAAGLANKEIAARLRVSPNTVKTHVARVFEKLGARRRTCGGSIDPAGSHGHSHRFRMYANNQKVAAPGRRVIALAGQGTRRS